MKKNLLIFILLMFALTSQSQIIISGEILANETWSNENIYLLNGWVYVRDGATLTIEPGTLIKGDFDTKGALIVERGGKLIADGTAAQPIVFTSQRAAGQRSYGDWGGVIFCGRASINAPENAGNGTAAGEAIIEGGVGSVYGGGANPNDDDDSGILRYVRIEFGGIPFQPNSEINGLTMGGVGRGTVIDHVQVSFSGDDAFEWFGGTVNCTNLIAYRNWDDDFDTDFGYRGNIQFALSVRDPNVADQSGSNGMESDNDAQGTGNTPITQAKFSNVTIVGPIANLSYANNQTINSNYKRALHLRRNTQTSVFNSVFAGYPVGLLIDGTATHTNAINADLRFKNSLVVGIAGDSLATSTNANPNNVSGAFDISAWFATTAYGNSLLNSFGELMFNNMDLNTPDLTLMNGSPLLNGADFSDSYLQNSFFTPTNFRGAFGTENWASCWSSFDPQNEAYNAATNNAITASIEVNGSAIVCEGEMINLSAQTNAQAAEYIWSNGSTEETMVVAAPISISVTIQSANGCSATSEEITLSNFPTPSVVVGADGATSFCTGGSVILSSDQASGNQWSNNATSQSITVTSTGSYSLTYTDGNGCEATSNSIDVSVSDTPVPTIGTSGATSICEGSTVVLTCSASDTYQWSLNGQIVDGANAQTWTATSEGAYTVTVTNTDQCDGVGTSNFVFVQVNPTPVAMFDFDTEFGSGVYEFNNNSTNATSYSWDFGDGSTSTETNPTHTFATGGQQTVVLVAVNGDCEHTFTLNISDVAVTDYINESNVSLYPNPTAQDVTLKVSAQNNISLLVNIYDITGKIVFSRKETGTSSLFNMILPSSEFESGIYFVSVEAGLTKEMIKLVVNR